MDYIALITDCVFLAFAAGLVYGLFGGGSGLIMTPGYYYLARHFHLTQDHRMQLAIATTATVSAMLGIFATRVQVKAKNVDASIIKKLLPGLTIGTILAVILLNVISSGFLKHLFGVVVISVGIWLWFYRQEQDHKQWSLSGLLNHARATLIGLLWFLLGIALFTVPYLHKTGVGIRRAIGCSSVVGTIYSALAAILLMITGCFVVGVSSTHVGYVNILITVISVVPSALAGILGSKLSHRLPQQLMKKVYAGLVVCVGVLMLI